MKENMEVQRDLLTQQLLTKATPLPDLKADFTTEVMAQIKAQTLAQRAKIYEPFLPAQVWRWIGISLSSIVLLTLSLSVLAFGPSPSFTLISFFPQFLHNIATYNHMPYLPELFLAGIICFCWLVLDHLYGRLRNN
ncbi:hypothetical protein [Adhaeribacter radiodurans]|uniref:DUF5056 domain-containing protein n=1 Tax=Adhaeribacter radiodurans TaxID=2745197 RepID=A0A7L7LEH3_9BACT|nr:hypothetical protein [Adhaeribacter radiodurans]QMU31173.1 hypothetical protein HUW48_25495 [Adhaeribacter radiodurans]